MIKLYKKNGQNDYKYECSMLQLHLIYVMDILWWFNSCCRSLCCFFIWKKCTL